ncbi:MAG: ArnT family glycosyltransferase [Dehalococcoidia bacterium]
MVSKPAMSPFSPRRFAEGHGVAARAIALAVRWGPFAAVLILAAVLYTWKLDQNGWGNTYYSAGAESMTRSWSNFFFGASDPEGIVTIDKPPLSQWLLASSVKLFGLNSWSLLLPQAILGVACVALLYAMVRPQFGEAAALLAAFVLATTPITVAIVRINNPDTLLVFLMLLGGWAGLRATARGSLGWALLAALFIGLAFNVKMLQAYLVVPGLALVYLVAAKGTWWRRAWTFAAAGSMLAAVSFSWMAVVDFWPEDSRPYVGGSRDNTVWDLAFGYNGLDRIDGTDPSAPFAGQQPAAPGGTQAPPPPPPAASGGPNFGGDPGWLRLLDQHSGPLIGWLLPFAGTVLLLGLDWRGRAARTDMRRAWLLFWGMWGLVHAAVFSTQEGIYHPYYTSALAPAVAALTGVGVCLALTWLREANWRRLLLIAAGTGYTATIQVFLTRERSEWNAWMVPALCLALSAGLLTIAASFRLTNRPRYRSVAGYGGVALTFGSLLIMPVMWGLTPLDGPRTSPDVAVGPQHVRTANASANAPRPGSGLGPNQPLVDYMLANYRGERFLVATFGAQAAAPILLSTGESVLPIGGFSGNDPVPDVPELAQMIEEGEIAFVLLSGAGPGARGERPALIARTCTVVPPGRYGGDAANPVPVPPPGPQPQGAPHGRPGQPAGGPPPAVVQPQQAPPGLYDCRDPR